MINKIINAVIKEAQAKLKGQGTLLFKTDYNPEKINSYAMPLVLIGMDDAPDAGQCIGGATIIDWRFDMNIYNYFINADTSEVSNVSIEAMEIIDDMRRHFSTLVEKNSVNTDRGWLTDEMGEAIQDYSFKFTLSGIGAADPIDNSGMIKGFKMIFDSIAIDVDTKSTYTDDETEVTFKQE